MTLMPGWPVKLFNNYPKLMAAVSAALLSFFMVETEISERLDGFILTEAEAADFAEQQRLTNYYQESRLIDLQLFHTTDPEERAQLLDRLRYFAEQIRILECLADPKMERELCLR